MTQIPSIKICLKASHQISLHGDNILNSYTSRG